MRKEILEFTCPTCNRRNKVTITLDGIFAPYSSCHCAYCGLSMGDIGSIDNPVCELINEPQED